MQIRLRQIVQALLFVALAGNITAGTVSEYEIPELTGEVVLDVSQAENPDGRQKQMTPGLVSVEALASMASPKSVILTSPRLPRSRFAGFRSRWSVPCA